MASVLKVDKLDPQSGTALEIGTSGDTVSIPSGATLDISASTLTPPATMPASSGVNFTALNASNLGSGTVPAARLSGVGKILQVQSVFYSTNTITATTSFVSMNSLNITPSATTSKIFGAFTTMIAHKGDSAATTLYSYLAVFRDLVNVHQTIQGYANLASDDHIYNNVALNFIDSPSTTSEVAYSMQVKMNGTSGYGQFNSGVANGVSMVLMEVGA
jgi:hypothetical protein